MQQKLKVTGHLGTEGVSAILSRAGRGNPTSSRNRNFQQIFETVLYLYKIHNEKTIDSSKIFFGEIQPCQKFITSVILVLGLLRPPHFLSFDKFAQDFQRPMPVRQSQWR